MNLRKHYKLYKSGKQWCTMALAVIASTIAMTTAVNADTNVANVSDQEVTSSTQNNSNDAILPGHFIGCSRFAATYLHVEIC